jgi:hypothetical protein
LPLLQAAPKLGKRHPAGHAHPLARLFQQLDKARVER